jgi:RNA polymerase sigma-70 factor (ECF subfamily)
MAVTQEEDVRSADLMRRTQQGDERAYAELLVLLAARARSYVRVRTRTPVTWQDDAVQEALIAIHEARHTYDARRPFAPWFYAILQHRFIDVLRREMRVQQREIAVDVWPEPAPPPAGESSIDLDLVLRALATLPPRQREIVEGLKLRDESVRDLAGRLGMSAGAVKVTAHRGYRALRRLLGGELREE